MGVELRRTIKHPEEIIIADEDNPAKYGFHAGSRNGITETCARKVITNENIPDGRDGEDNPQLGPSFDKFFISKDEALDDFEVLVKDIGGGWGKSMIRNTQNGTIMFRSSTCCTDEPYASNYRPSHDPSWKVGKRCFTASRKFWTLCAKYFEEHPFK